MVAEGVGKLEPMKTTVKNAQAFADSSPARDKPIVCITTCDTMFGMWVGEEGGPAMSGP